MVVHLDPRLVVPKADNLAVILVSRKAARKALYLVDLKRSC